MPSFRSALIAVACVLALTAPAGAAGLSAFKGSYRGLMFVAQGKAKTSPRLIFQADVKVVASGSNAKFNVVVTNSEGKKFPQVITIAPGKSTYSVLIPALEGFQVPMAGISKGGGRRITVAGPSEPSNYTFGGRIEFTNFGQVLSISSKISLQGNPDPIYVSILAY